ncbi:DUF433 domain-containing protein [Planktothrix sp. PCC 11201]|uniref:DUF433 domain-containing protein n=1 Tax=Planktothrix sp. PCC 11201 TaxID=1729650 RepID=UPI001F3F9C03|nr:DUF433 domain-containing protein [Planktothrix sp. PCC 11201]
MNSRKISEGLEIMSMGLDVRDLPNYSLTEAAKYLQLPTGTLRSWVYGRYYPTRQGKKYFAPLIELASEKKLSFTNLIEAHVLSAIRRLHQVPLAKVRAALDYLNQEFSAPHPLAKLEFQTDGVNLFVEQFGELLNVSLKGQLALKEVFYQFLSRIERDPSGLPIKLFPFTRNFDINAPKIVVIDPYISFGRPVLMGTGIPTIILAERYKAGESIHELAIDYQCERSLIEEGIRSELDLVA